MEETIPTFRIFVSSPADVRDEREAAAEVIGRLKLDYQDVVELDPYFWEDRVFLADKDFQANIPEAGDYDVIVMILWSRLGSKLDTDQHVREDGSAYESGTAYEYESALAGRRSRGTGYPKILVYRKGPMLPVIDQSKREEFNRQLDALEAYWKRHFENEHDNTNKAAFTRFPTREKFKELLDAHLRQLIDDFIHEKFAEREWPFSPYPGMRPYRVEESSIFYGRPETIAHILNGLQRIENKPELPFVLLVGDSGAGKSSLLRAGVCHKWIEPGERTGLHKPWILIEPSSSGFDLLEAFIRALRSAQGIEGLTELECSQAVQDCRNAPETLFHFLDKCLPKAKRPLLLVIDQLEEILSGSLPAETKEKADHFFNALRMLLERDMVVAVAGMRVDLMSRVQELPALDRLADKGLVKRLPALHLADIQAIVRIPALKSGIRFEMKDGISLSQRMVEDALVLGREAVALLQFALHRMYDALGGTSTGGPKVCTFRKYEELGGVSGALAGFANSVHEQLNPAERVRFERLVRHLVRIDARDRVPVRRWMAYTGSADHEDRNLLERLVNARLLTARKIEGGQEEIGLAHEVLIEQWEAVANVVARERTLLENADYANIDARRWKEQDGKADGMLWSDPDRRTLARELQANGKDYLNPEGIDFVDRSVEHAAQREADARRSWRQKRNLRLGAFLSLIGFTAFIAFQFFTIEQERDRVKALAEREARSYLKVAKGLVVEFRGDDLMGHGLTWAEDDTSRRAIAHLLRAQELDTANTEARALLYEMFAWRFAAVYDPPDMPIIQHDGPCDLAVFDRKGEHILTVSANTARVWTMKGDSLSKPIKHAGMVSSAAFNPSGKNVVTASADSTARVWTIKGDSLSKPMQHVGMVSSAAFDPSGMHVVTASEDSTARVWTINGDSLSKPMKHDGRVYSAAFDPSGKHVITASDDGTARVWTINGNSLYKAMMHGGAVRSAAFDPSGMHVLTASDDGTARVWTINGDSVSKPMKHGGGVRSAAFDPSGKHVVTISGRTTRVWTIDGDSISKPMKHSGWVYSAAFDPSGKYVVTASDGTARVWSINGDSLSKPMKHGDGVNSAAFDPSGKYVVTSSSDGTARVWSITGDSPPKPMKHDSGINSATFDPSGKYVVTASDFTARVWSITGDSLSKPMKHDGWVISTAFDPSGKYVVTASYDRTARVWTIKGDSLSKLMRHDDWVESAAFSPSGKYVVTSSSNGIVRVWTITGDSLSKAMKHEDFVNSAAFDPSDKYAVTASDDGTARVWSITGDSCSKPMKHDSRVNSAAFDPSGMFVVTASDDFTARIWSIDGDSISKPMKHDSRVNSAAFDPSGKYVVTASDDGTARVWSITGDSLSKPMKHDGRVYSAAFERTGRFIVTSAEGFIYVWRVEGDQVGIRIRHDAESLTDRTLNPWALSTLLWIRTYAWPMPPYAIPPPPTPHQVAILEAINGYRLYDDGAYERIPQKERMALTKSLPTGNNPWDCLIRWVMRPSKQTWTDLFLP